jgi:hypothetical protein
MIKAHLDPQSVRMFKSRLQDYVEEAGKTYQEGIEQLGKACAKELAITVPPFGLSAKVGEKYKLSIAKQVNRAVSAANVQGVQGDASQVHKKFRNRRGQVPKDLVSRGQYKREPVSVRDKETQVRRKMDEAGTAKGAWIAAGEKINSKKIGGVGKWVRRHATRNGSAKVKIKGMGSEIAMTNSISYVQNLQKTGYVEKALKRGYLRAFRHMTIMVKKLRKEI